jgi:hypothetical protein
MPGTRCVICGRPLRRHTPAEAEVCNTTPIPIILLGPPVNDGRR